MRITYDKTADAAYVYLISQIAPGQVARTETCEIREGVQVNFDFDKQGRLLGLEILDASKLLTPETLQNGRSQ